MLFYITKFEPLRYNNHMTEKASRQFAKKIKQARTDKRLSQEQVAIKAKISKNYYARVERGEVSPSLDVATQIAKALSINLSL